MEASKGCWCLLISLNYRLPPARGAAKFLRFDSPTFKALNFS